MAWATVLFREGRLMMPDESWRTSPHHEHGIIGAAPTSLQGCPPPATTQGPQPRLCLATVIMLIMPNAVVRLCIQYVCIVPACIGVGDRPPYGVCVRCPWRLTCPWTLSLRDVATGVSTSAEIIVSVDTSDHITALVTTPRIFAEAPGCRSPPLSFRTKQSSSSTMASPDDLVGSLTRAAIEAGRAVKSVASEAAGGLAGALGVGGAADRRRWSTIMPSAFLGTGPIIPGAYRHPGDDILTVHEAYLASCECGGAVGRGC